MTFAVMTSPPERPRVEPLTVDQYHRMISAGILAEGRALELLDGMLVHKVRSGVGEDEMTVNPRHAGAVRRLAQLANKLTSLGCYIQTQQPVSLGRINAPEPDGAVIAGTEDDFDGRHPRADEILCIFEVSDASLQHDRTTKLRIYADAGIPAYAIVNLVDRVIEFYTEPMKGKGRFAKSVTLKPSESLSLPTGGKPVSVKVRQLLPTA